MNAKTFHDILEYLKDRTPFEPFTVELIDGQQFTVQRKSSFVFRDGLAVHLDLGPNPALHRFNWKNVAPSFVNLGQGCLAKSA